MTATLKRNGNGYGYRYTDLSEIHRYLEQVGFRYYQEIETLDGEDYVNTHILDATGKEIRKCRGCRVAKITGKNAAQDYGSALTYARRYSLLLAFGLATSDGDGTSLTPTKSDRKPRPERKVVDKAIDRTEAVNRISLLVNSGRLSLEDVQATVRKYGASKMNELPDDAFVECIATLTKSA
jgi:hypothetical protein